MLGELGVTDLILTVSIALVLWGVSRFPGARRPGSAATSVEPPESVAARAYLDRLFGPARR